MKALILIYVFTLATSVLYAKEASRFGISGNIGLNHHIADFRALPDVPNCCPQFTSGIGLGYKLGLFYEYGISEKFALQSKLNLVNHSALLAQIEPELLNFEGSKIDGEFEHRLDVTLASFGLDALAVYRFNENFYGLAGITTGFLFSHEVDQVEEIVTPADRGVFVDTGTRTRNHFTGEIKETNLLIAGISIGVRYELPMNTRGTMKLAPEMSYNLGLFPVVRDYTWTSNSLMAGVSLIFELGSEDMIPVPVEEEPGIPEDVFADSDESPVGDNVADIQLTARGVRNGIESDVFKVIAEEFLSTSMKPLLNYVFFAEGSSLIPGRYQKLEKDMISNFNVDDLYNQPALETYYNILNIIGKRMQIYPDAEITITGCNSNNGIEEGNINLSMERSEVVANYLEQTWNIDEGRINSQYSGLPENPSNIDDPDGIAENRRTEITSTFTEILEPVISNDTIIEINPPVLRFYTKATGIENPSGWRITAKQDGKILKIIEGDGAPPLKVDWNIGRDRKLNTLSTTALVYQIEIMDENGNEIESELNYLPVERTTIQKKKEERISDKRIDKYSLILFEYDKYALDNKNRGVSGYIKNNIESNSDVKIVGFTDRVGEASYNLQLSERRASEVAKELGLPRSSAFGFGETQPIFTNDLPEGRFYNRTVEVIVETPLKWE